MDFDNFEIFNKGWNLKKMILNFEKNKKQATQTSLLVSKQWDGMNKHCSIMFWKEIEIREMVGGNICL